MRKLLGCLFVIATLAGSQAEGAAQRGTKEEAQALCDRAVDA